MATTFFRRILGVKKNGMCELEAWTMEASVRADLVSAWEEVSKLTRLARERGGLSKSINDEIYKWMTEIGKLFIKHKKWSSKVYASMLETRRAHSKSKALNSGTSKAHGSGTGTGSTSRDDNQSFYDFAVHDAVLLDMGNEERRCQEILDEYKTELKKIIDGDTGWRMEVTPSVNTQAVPVFQSATMQVYIIRSNQSEVLE